MLYLTSNDFFLNFKRQKKAKKQPKAAKGNSLFPDVSAGAWRLLRNQRMPRILYWQGKHSRARSFRTDQSQLSSKEWGRAK
jgi:hypothetical protein